MTLIEVMAGLALLGTLLVTILLAKGRYTRMWARANLRSQAVSAADHLLTAWWATSDSLLRPDAGGTDVAELAWRRSLLENDAAKTAGLQVVRLEVFDDRPEQIDPVRVVVDVVVPLKGQAP
jgi:type II secretory pathway pseudopilin PulG